MSMKILEQCTEFKLIDHLTRHPKVSAFGADQELKGGERALTTFMGLMGESHPATSPFSPNYSLDDNTAAYRYDWIFGIGCLNSENFWWDWKAAMRDTKALCVRFLISTAHTGFAVTELSATLHGLQPSKNTKSWLECHSKQLAETLVSVAGATESILPSKVGAVLRTSAAISNFVNSDSASGKNWHIYRYLDIEKRCSAVEWNIHKTVLDEFGPLLRGSLILTFHGERAKDSDKAVSIEMRAGLGFFPEDEICYVQPTRAEGVTPLILNIVPENRK